MSENKGYGLISGAPSVRMPWVAWAFRAPSGLWNPCGCATEQEALARLADLTSQYGGCGLVFKASEFRDVHESECEAVDVAP